MSDLVEFLLARIAEDEQEARAGFSNQEDPENGWGMEGCTVIPHVGVIHEDIQRAHVVKWHPGRVLAEVEAKRQIIDEHVNVNGGCKSCADWAPSNDETESAEFPCLTLRLLALPYDDHPHFHPSWLLHAPQA